jgi:predicted ATPase
MPTPRSRGRDFGAKNTRNGPIGYDSRAVLHRRPRSLRRLMSISDLDASNPGRVLRSNGHWRLELLGGMSASNGQWKVSHFPGRPVAALLARLVMFPQRSHAREELIELLWPGVEIDVGRNRLRQALSTLRSLLEAPGSSARDIILADRTTVRINSAGAGCDVLEFEAACRRRDDASALTLYHGELLPGFYDSWIVDERSRLEALHQQLVEREASSAANATALALPRSQLAAAASPSAPVVPHTRTARLPSYLSSFVGRERETSQCLEMIERHRLVTLTGMGGCGKTRLATEVARASVSFDAVFFIGLADCRDGTELADYLHVAARLPNIAGGVLDQVVSHLSERRALLVFDNFEQLVGSGGPEALSELLTALPLAHALVTSRRVLHLAGEQEQALSPLTLPGADDDLQRAMRNPAVALFIERARGVRGDFRISAANREDLLVLCRTLEGLPLALEIAASRIRTYSLREMRSELVRGLSMLVRSAPQAAREPRHASLQAAIDWSWRLLSPRTQRFLGDLTAFRGGCSSADVRAVTGAEDAHDLLDVLVADSLLAVNTGVNEDPAQEPRFQMLESVREFVAERVDASRVAELRQAHRAYFLSRAMALAERHLPVATPALGNFIEAVQSALDDGEYALALSLLLALKEQWESVGTPPEALTLMRRAALTLPAGIERFSNFLSMFARLLLLAGHSADALDFAARALEAAGDDVALRAEAMFARTRVEWVWKREGPKVIDAAVEGVRLAREAGTQEVEASALSLWAAIILWGLDRPREAEPIYEQAEALYLALGNPRGALQALHGRMGCLYATQRYALAIEMGTKLEKQSHAVGNVEAEVVSLNLLVACYAKLRRYADALDAAHRETRLAHKHHKIYNIVHGLWGQAFLLARLRRPEEAATMSALSERYWIDHLGALPAAEQRESQRVRRLVIIQIGQARWEQCRARGFALPFRDGIRLACGE